METVEKQEALKKNGDEFDGIDCIEALIVVGEMQGLQRSSGETLFGDELASEVGKREQEDDEKHELCDVDEVGNAQTRREAAHENHSGPGEGTASHPCCSFVQHSSH